MKHSFIVALAASSLVLSILACSAPARPAQNQPNYVATITAQAALIGQPTGQATATTAASTSQAPTDIPTTPTSSAATAQVTNNTNCRSGPGANYALVTTLSAGQTVTIVGQDTADNYWIVDNPNASGTCWLWGQYATVSGDLGTLSQVSAPPPPTPKATKTPKPVVLPAAPTDILVLVDKGCTATKNNLGGYNIKYSVQLSWADPDLNATGFRVYQGSTLLTTMEAGPNEYQGSGTVVGNSDPTNINFGIQAFNKSGSSARVDVTGKCQ